jgi:outer membrane protein TolC
MRQFVIGLTALMLLAPPLPAQDAAPSLTLEQVLKRALGANEQIAEARENVDYSRLLRRAAWSAFIPQVSANGSFIRNDSEISFDFGDMGGEGGESEPITIQAAWDYNFNLHVGSPLYMGGILERTVEQAGINIKLTETQLSKTQLDVLFSVAAAAGGVVKAQREVGIAQVSLELAQRQLKHATILFNAGEAIRTSVTRAEAQVAEAEMNLIGARNGLDQAKQDLRTLVDLPADFELIDLVTPALPAGEADALVRLGLQNRREMSVLDRQKELTLLEAEKAFGKKLPQLDWGYTYVKQRAGFPSSDFWQASLNLKWTIYDSGLSTIEKAERESEIRKLELNRQLLTRQISAEIVKAWLDYTSVVKGREAAARALAAVRQAYDDIERFYQAGEATDLDVQDLRKQLINAETISANLETDEKLALYRLRHALGLPVIELPEAF